MLVKLPQGTITQEQVLPEVYVGKVVRSLRRADPQVQITIIFSTMCIIMSLVFTL